MIAKDNLTCPRQEKIWLNFSEKWEETDILSEQMH